MNLRRKQNLTASSRGHSSSHLLVCADFGTARTRTAGGATPVTGSIIVSGPSESVSCLLVEGGKGDEAGSLHRSFKFHDFAAGLCGSERSFTSLP